jgi:hypothetical protein
MQQINNKLPFMFSFEDNSHSDFLPILIRVLIAGLQLWTSIRCGVYAPMKPLLLDTVPGIITRQRERREDEYDHVGEPQCLVTQNKSS